MYLQQFSFNPRRVVDFMVKQGIPVSEPIYTALVTGHCRNKLALNLLTTCYSAFAMLAALSVTLFGTMLALAWSEMFILLIKLLLT